MAQTTVFQSGNSQAVRLPKEFRIHSKTVEIFRRGDEIVLREKSARTMGELIQDLPLLGDDFPTRETTKPAPPIPPWDEVK
jgi:antitoxin VapB